MTFSRNLTPGTDFGPYRVIRKIGSGGMGDVYECEETALGRRVALKVISPHAVRERTTLERFKGEGRALAKLKHPNIVGVYASGELDSTHYLAMEYVSGEALNLWLMERSCGLADILRLFRMLLEGVGAAHANGVIHRDLKPQNLLVDESGTMKIIDFGIAKADGDGRSVQTTTNVVIGTLNYLAPELFRGQAASVQSDIFSLGLVLYNMLTGQTAFEGNSQFEVIEKIRSRDLLLPGRVELLLPRSLVRVLMRMTSKSTDIRYKSIDDVLKDLAEIGPDQFPAEFRFATKPLVKITNAAGLRNRCRDKGFSVAEATLILKLAADAPDVEERSDGFVVSDANFDSAMNQFTRKRAILVNERAQPKPEQPSGSSIKHSLGFGAFVAALVIGYVLTRPTAVRGPASAPAPVVTRAAAAVLPKPASVEPASLESASTKPASHESASQESAPQETALPKPASLASAPPKPGSARHVDELAVGHRQHVIGDKYEYSVRSQAEADPAKFEEATLQWEITKVEGDSTTRLGERGDIAIFSNTSPLVSEAQKDDGRMPDYKEFVISQSNSLFPLQLGKVHSVRKRRVYMDGRVLILEGRCEVKVRETIEVPAGSFDSFRVDCEIDPVKHKSTFWFSATVPLFVKAVYYTTDSSGERTLVTRELLRFTRAR